MQRKGNNSTIKLDLCWDEVFVEPPIKKPIHHPYSDKQFDFYVQTYCIEEIFAEKLRALVERMRPRDLYDIIHLFYDRRWTLNREKVSCILQRKCTYKSVPIPSIEYINRMPERIDLETDWENMLVHQIYALEHPEYYWKKLPAVFDWLNSR
jgi:predicted nucleotidyltransferase component of viral defense system